MPSLRDRLGRAEVRLARLRAEAEQRHTHPPESAWMLLGFLVPITGMIWAGAWLLAGYSWWLTIPLATAATTFFFRCLPAPFIPLHTPVVPKWGNWLLVVWLWLGWGGMLWILLG